MWIVDSFVNLISGMGGPKDKNSYNQYVLNQLTKQQLDAAYRGDWVARKTIDIPAFDSTRKWREWLGADADQIEKLEEFERNFGLQQKIMQAMIKARLYGGAALVMGVNQGNPDEELDVERVGKDDLEFVHVVSRWEINAGPRILDIMSPWYGEPSYYERINTPTDTLRVHPSRVVRLLGNDVPDPTLSTDGWGDSVLQAIDDAIRACGVVTGGIASMVQEAKVDVVKIPGLTKNIQTKKYEQGLTTRFQYANAAKSIINTIVLDKEEDWARITQTFTALPDVLKMYLLIVSAAADIPSTRMLSQSPTGMSATGDSDTRNYYDRINADQTVRLSPALSRLDEVSIRSVFGTRDPSIYYQWESLWQMDEKQSADIQLIKAQTHQIDVTNGLINPDTLRQARVEQLIEDGFYPGFEKIVEDTNGLEAADLPDLLALPPNDPNADPALIARQKAQLQLPPPKGASAPPPRSAKPPSRFVDTNDAAQPRTLYMRRDIVNKNDLEKWARRQGFKNVLDDMHVTIVYSRSAFDWMAAGDDYGHSKDGQITVGPGGPRVMEVLGDDAIALLFSSSELCWRHESILRAGATHDYNDFTPHVTITNDLGDVDLDKVEPYQGPLVFGPEIWEELDAGKAFVPPKTREKQLVAEAAEATFDAASFTQSIMDGVRKTLSEFQPAVPVVNLTVSKSGRVMKDITHDAQGRAVKIVETEEKGGRVVKDITHDQKGRIVKIIETEEDIG
jgi:phage-related protein (TIGR01555 family)